MVVHTRELTTQGREKSIYTENVRKSTQLSISRPALSEKVVGRILNNAHYTSRARVRGATPSRSHAFS